MRAHQRIVVPTLALLAAGGLGFGLMAMAPAPGSAPAPAAAAAGKASYTADPVHSSVVFNIMHAGAARFWGYISEVSGDFELGSDGGSFNFEIPVEKIYTGSARRDEHLKSADFFNAAQFKTIAFKSTDVSSAGDGKWNVKGDLTMLGETKPVTVEVTKTGEGSIRETAVVGVEGKLKIKRSDWGMSFMVGGGLGDEVEVIVSVEGREQ